MEDPHSDYQAAYEIGLSREPVAIVDGDDVHQLLIVPHGARIEDPEHVLANPRRVRSKAVFYDSDSFIHYVGQYQTRATKIMAGASSSGWVVEACLDHHMADTPGWKEHTARLSPPCSSQWKEWREIDRKSMNQQDFADFIEDHLTDIYSPDAADLLSICLSFTRSAKSEFTQNRRLEDGSYSVTVSDEGKAEGMSVAGAKVTVPDRLGVTVPVFRYEDEGADQNTALIRASLRTRVTDGKLTFTIRLQQAEEILESAQQSLIDKIATATGITVYRGSSL